MKLGILCFILLSTLELSECSTGRLSGAHPPSPNTTSESKPITRLGGGESSLRRLRSLRRDSPSIIIGKCGPLKKANTLLCVGQRDEEKKLPGRQDPEAERLQSLLELERKGFFGNHASGKHISASSSSPLTSTDSGPETFRRQTSTFLGRSQNSQACPQYYFFVPIHTKEVAFWTSQHSGQVTLPESVEAALDSISRRNRRRTEAGEVKIVLLIQGRNAENLAFHVREEKARTTNVDRSSSALRFRPELDLLTLSSQEFISTDGNLEGIGQGHERRQQGNGDHSSRAITAPNGMVIRSLRDSVSTQRNLSDAVKTCRKGKRRLEKRATDSNALGMFSRTATNHIRRNFHQFCTRSLNQSGKAQRQRAKDHVATLLVNDVHDIISRGITWFERRARLRLGDRLSFLFERGMTEDQTIAQAVTEAQLCFLRDTKNLIPTLMGDYRLELDRLALDCCAGLEAYASKFVNSPLAQLSLHLKRSNRSYASRLSGFIKAVQNLRVALGLTSMIRHSGNGNLQGFANCNVGPVSFTLGYANDRNAAEAAYGGKKPPIFRVQPRFHFEFSR